MEGIGIMAVAAGCAHNLTADLAQAAIKLAAIPSGVLSHKSGGKNKLIPKGGRDGAACFQQCLKMRLGGLLETEHGFPAVASMRMAAGQRGAFGHPDTVFVSTQLNLRERNNHRIAKIAIGYGDVKAVVANQRCPVRSRSRT